MIIKNKFDFLEIGNAKFDGFSQKVVDFISAVQLKDKELWAKCFNLFGTDVDVQDKGWRGEYWGKMMRGACLMYAYTKDEELYNTLLCAVEGLLSKQEPSGRISTYDVENEFDGWDMWARKYVLVGLEYFYRICKDETFKQTILSALVKHADYIIERIGVGEGKKPIEETSNFYSALNSCSSLDSFLQLYKLTRYERYLQFAEYIISVGGAGGGNLIKCVEEDILKVHEFPQTKAYELMSFFEGLLTYYECTGNEYYLNIVLKLFEDLQEQEQTIIGGMGTRFEFFDDSTNKQTEYSDLPMLETCVTVTWIRVLTRLLALTGDVKYADRIEIAVYNALYGAVNFDMLPQYCFERDCKLDGLPFDSYSPLYAYHRGDRIGGYKAFPDGTHYGCCACIGAAAVALFPLGAVMTEENGVVVNYYLNGSAKTRLSSGNTVKVEISTAYPCEEKISIRFIPEKEENFSVKLRIPEWAQSANVIVGEQEYSAESGYLLFVNVVGETEVLLEMPLTLQASKRNGKTAFSRGPIVLARDEEKEGERINFDKIEDLERQIENDFYQYKMLPAQGDEHCRCELKTVDGRKIILSDYATCGEKWTGELKFISVWLNVR